MGDDKKISDDLQREIDNNLFAFVDIPIHIILIEFNFVLFEIV